MTKLLLCLCFAAAVSAQDVLVIFSDSPDGDVLYDSSWGFVSSPSTLELAGNNDKVPVETENVFYGAHSLRLNWQSKSGGDWGVAVASRGWKAMDFTQYDSLIYWINSDKTISGADLPSIAIEDMSNNKSERLTLGDYLGDVDGDPGTWQRLSIPIVQFQGGSGVDMKKIKTVYHFQRASDAVRHTAFIDEIRAIRKNGGSVSEPTPPTGLAAAGYDSRIDLNWSENLDDKSISYFVYGADSPDGPFTRLTKVVHGPVWYSDFFGENNKTRYYYITAVNSNFLQSAPSAVVSATSHEMNEDELLTSVQEAAFRYFYYYGHPVSGLARERVGSGNTCTSGGSGFGLMNFPIAVERNFISREDAAARVLKICLFLRDQATRYHGAWSHWINGKTGDVIPFSQYDDGADLVETSYAVQGLLTVRQYFDHDDAVEGQIRDIATQLWQEVDWSWFRKESQENVLYWHWSPNYGWHMNMQIRGFNETMIAYILAVASPTHGVPKMLYDTGWTQSGYRNGNSYYGIVQPVGPPKGGPLFFTHYSFLGLNPHMLTDKFCNYFDNNRNISLIHRAYSMQNPKNCRDYSGLDWGLTASDDYNGYSAHSPTNDNCTITPTAAISAMPYTPDESIATLKHFYYDYGDRLWGEFGFKDAFSIEEDWFANSVLAIDQGTIGPMIENYRTQLLWNLFMSNAEIQSTVKLISTARRDSDAPIAQYELAQNYPNPFNPSTTIEFRLPRKSTVTLVLIDVLGKEAARIYDHQSLAQGKHKLLFDASSLSSGVYLLSLQADDFSQARKILLVR